MTVAMQNNPREPNYGANVWHTYQRLFSAQPPAPLRQALDQPPRQAAHEPLSSNAADHNKRRQPPIQPYPTSRALPGQHLNSYEIIVLLSPDSSCWGTWPKVYWIEAAPGVSVNAQMTSKRSSGHVGGMTVPGTVGSEEASVGMW